jgi:hypothetical protein
MYILVHWTGVPFPTHLHSHLITPCSYYLDHCNFQSSYPQLLVLKHNACVYFAKTRNSSCGKIRVFFRITVPANLTKKKIFVVQVEAILELPVLSTNVDWWKQSASNSPHLPIVLTKLRAGLFTITLVIVRHTHALSCLLSVMFLSLHHPPLICDHHAHDSSRSSQKQQ